MNYNNKDKFYFKESHGTSNDMIKNFVFIQVRYFK